ncbi:acylphosphatase organ-common type isozyme variant 1 [Nannochloropsis oceanica]
MAASPPSREGSDKPLWHMDWEVCGKVQGVWFRRYTVEKAQSLGLVGWCSNTVCGTVKGEAEGPPEMLEVFRYWLQNEGSPQSRVSNAIFKNERRIDITNYKDFGVRNG